MDKITIKMSYTGENVEGQGVGAATLEQVNLIKDLCKDEFNVQIKKGRKFDILHVHTVNLSSYFSATRTKKPTVAHVHFLPETLEGSIKLPKLFMKVFAKYFLKLYRSVDNLVVVNPIFIEDLVKYKIPRERITYIPNFVSEETFKKLEDSQIEKIKDEFGISKDAFVVIGVGQVQTRKGVLDFLEVAKKCPNLTFVWAGGFSFGAITDGYKELKNATENPPSNVKFLGIIPRARMNEIYNIANVLFMPSYNELFPMAILESCSVGTPLLLRDLELYKDILFDGYVRSNDNDSFAKILNGFANNDQSYQDAISHAAKIKQYYSRENIRKIWIEFYQNVYKNGKRSKKNK